jgi:hypothetical protein
VSIPFLKSVDGNEPAFRLIRGARFRVLYRPPTRRKFPRKNLVSNSSQLGRLKNLPDSEVFNPYRAGMLIMKGPSRKKVKQDQLLLYTQPSGMTMEPDREVF